MEILRALLLGSVLWGARMTQRFFPMGLGLHLKTALPDRPWKRQGPTAEEVLGDIASLGGQFADALGKPFSEWYRAELTDGALTVRFVPFEEDIEIFLDGDALTCSAKTSTAGPGYHQALVAFLDRTSQNLGLRWQEDGDDSLDETGYFIERDAVALRNAMCRHLQELARIITGEAREGLGSIRLGLPVDTSFEIDAFAASAVGTWSAEWFEALERLGPEDLAERAREFFPWWSAPPSAGDYLNFGLSLCWLDALWVPPASEAERAVYHRIVECFDACRKAGGGGRVPGLVEAEIRRLLDGEGDGDPPTPGGIGFRRGLWRRPFVGKWSIELPGYFHELVEDDGQSMTYFFGDRVVRGSALSIGGAEDPGALIASHDGEPFDLPSDDRVAKIQIEPDDEGEGVTVYLLVAAAGGLCIVTMSLGDAADLPWAEERARTITLE